MFQVVCGKNGVNSVNSLLVNNKAIGTVNTSTTSTATLSINGCSGKTGNFGFTYLIIWKTQLSDTQLQQISNSFMKYIFNNTIIPIYPIQLSGNLVSVDLSAYAKTTDITNTYQPKISSLVLNPSGNASISNSILTINLPTFYSSLTVSNKLTGSITGNCDGNAATATTANNTNTLNSGNCFNANEWYNSSDGSLRIYFERNSRMLIHYNTYFYHYMEVAGGIYASGTLSTSAGRIGVAGIDGEHVWWNNSFSGPVSIKAAGDILTGGHILMSSDIRIKKNIININDDFALQKILTIEPKKYNYIDTRKGFNDVYGFIAQQIKQVIPEAILLQDIVVPNIYGVYNLNSNVITINNSNLYLNSNVCLNINDKIQIYDYNNKEFNCKIIDINDNQITIDTYITGSNCLVYGTDVNDFHTIDKHYIYTLNVGATQELYKIIQKQQKEIDTLNYKLNKLLETLNITLD